MRAAVALALSLTLVAPVRAQPADVIAGIRVHGNHTTPDGEVLVLAGLSPGGSATDEALDAARARLRMSGRFADVELRRRYASLADPTQVMVIIIVSERPGVAEDHLTPGVGRRVRASAMWMPVLGYEDGYGFTYGARASVVDVAGPRTRISMPLTWGGERRAAVEVERTFERGPLTRLTAVGGLGRRENPFDHVADTRRVLGLRAERAFAPWLRAGAGARRERISFDGRTATLTAAGAEAVIDTRLDPSFPRNAVYASTGLERLRFEDGRGARRWVTEARGYLGLPGASVLAAGGRASLADAPLPRYERALLGGASTVRGTRAGSAAGDNLAAMFAEWRLPLTSPLSIGRFGVKVFVDAGTTWDAGETLRGRRFTRGTGGGVFFGASALTVNVDAGRSGGRTRWHAGLGVTF